MAQFKVTWEVDVEADDEVSAARVAKFYQSSRISHTKHASAANVFNVTGKDGHTTRVDLDGDIQVRR